MNRRDLLKMPAAMALPAAAQTPTTDPGPFDSHQSDTIAALSELIMPGAKAAQVPRYIETILRDSTSEERSASPTECRGWTAIPSEPKANRSCDSRLQMP